jgi:hypothetical protein
MPSEGENDHEKPIALCKRKGIRGYDADPDVRRRSCAISGNNTLGSLTGLSERKSWRLQRFRAPPQVRSGPIPVVSAKAIQQQVRFRWHQFCRWNQILLLGSFSTRPQEAHIRGAKM